VPKLKTHKGAAARFRITGTGKMMRMKGGSSHLRRNKAYRAKSQYDTKVAVDAADVPRLRKLLPNGTR